MLKEHMSCLTDLDSNIKTKYVLVVSHDGNCKNYINIIASVKLNLASKESDNSEAVTNLISSLKDFVKHPAELNPKKIPGTELYEKLKKVKEPRIQPANSINSLPNTTPEQIEKLKGKSILYYRHINDITNSYYRSVSYGYFELIIKKGLAHVEVLCKL